MQPYDYTIQAQRPADAMTAGIGRGVQLSQMFEQQKASQLKQEALATQQEQARIMQADLAELSANKTATAQDFTALMVKYPPLSEHLSKSYEILDEDQKRNATTQSLQVYSAINAGQTDVAEGLLEEKMQAATNSGDDEAAKRAGIMLQLVRTNPDAAKTSAGLFLANTMGKEKFAEVFTKLEGETRAAELQPGIIKKAASDLGFTEAKTKKTLADVKKTGLETQKLALELESLKTKDGAIVDPQKRFDAEGKLRNEYVKNTQDFAKTQDAFRKINAASDDAIGDLSLIFSFMKMLDPGSTVREGEFATAQNAAGVSERIRNMYNQAMAGERLSPSQRKNFKGQAGKLLDASSVREKEVRKGLEKVVTNYGLNSKNVFYTDEQAEEQAEGALITEPAVTKTYMKYSGGR